MHDRLAIRQTGDAGPGKRTTRFGKSVPVDAVFEAWTSGDIARMRAVLHTPTNLIERDHLLANMVEQLYLRREDPAIRKELFEVGATHLSEMPELRAAARADRIAQHECNLRHAAERAARHGVAPMQLPPFDPDLRFGVATFGALSRAYCEIKNYEAARDVWRVACRVGYLGDKQLERELEGVAKQQRKYGPPEAQG